MGMSHDDFPARVRAERKRQRLTQQQLADTAHVSLRTIQMFEGRKSAATPANRRAIAQARASAISTRGRRQVGKM